MCQYYLITPAKNHHWAHRNHLTQVYRLKLGVLNPRQSREQQVCFAHPLSSSTYLAIKTSDAKCGHVAKCTPGSKHVGSAFEETADKVEVN